MPAAIAVSIASAPVVVSKLEFMSAMIKIQKNKDQPQFYRLLFSSYFPHDKPLGLSFTQKNSQIS
jgi:hypothetical protein